MHKCQIESVAKQIASEEGAKYGMSVFDGKWYVGTDAELYAAGIPASDRLIIGDNMVTVEVMPECHRASHRAAGNWGVYPRNGAERVKMAKDEAEAHCADDEDGYDHIVK